MTRPSAHPDSLRGRRRPRPPVSDIAQVCLVAAASISGVATLGSSTGLPLVDRLLRGGLAGAVALAATTAPTAAIVVLASAAATLGWSGGSIGATTGLAALAVVLVLTLTDKFDRQLLKGATGALSTMALLRASGGRLGVTAVAMGLLAALIFVTSRRFRRHPRHGRRRERRDIALVAAGMIGFAAIAAVLGGIAGLMARPAFERSAAATEMALVAARTGDSATAATQAGSAARDLGKARRSLEVWWARPAWALPIVGAHLRAADEVARSAGPAVEAAAASVELLRLDGLRLESGQLDVEKLAIAQPEVARLSKALHGAQRGARRARSPWLLAPLQRRLDGYETQLTSLSTTSDRALLALDALPRLVGVGRPTRWFVAVGNPAESRELGGCVCEYVIITVDRGKIELDRAGSVEDIGSHQVGRNLDGVDLPKRYLAQQPELYWQNLGGYPDMPTVATTARRLWEQVSPGSPIDGVIYLDPLGLASILKLTGPVIAEPPLGNLTAENAPQLLLRDQYLSFATGDERKDGLHQAVAAIFAALAERPLPGPTAIGEALGPAVQGGHLAITSFDETGQRLFDELGASGRFPRPSGGDLASLRTTNLGEDKLDAYIRRSIRYQATVDPPARRVEATATIELRNDATPALPDVVTGWVRRLPRGTALLVVTWYSGLPAQSVAVDGRPSPVRSTLDRGWWTHSVTVQISAGGVTKVAFQLAGTLDKTRPYQLSVAPQASAYVDPYVIEVTGTSGWTTAPVPGPIVGRRADLVIPFSPSPP